MKGLIESLRARWSALADRDRRVLGIGGVIAAVLLAYAAVWEPMHGWRAAREQALTDARGIATRLEQVAGEVQRAPVPGARPAAGGSLLANVDQATKSGTLGKAPTRLQPEGDTLVRVWLDDVSYDAVVRWLHELQTRYGVRVDTADFEKQSAPGRVNVRLTLARGP